MIVTYLVQSLHFQILQELIIFINACFAPSLNSVNLLLELAKPGIHFGVKNLGKLFLSHLVITFSYMLV